jgi:hypothetical protein
MLTKKLKSNYMNILFTDNNKLLVKIEYHSYYNQSD